MTEEQENKPTQEIIFEMEDGSDNIQVQCHTFNDDEYRFVIILGDYENDNDEDAYRLSFLSN